MEKITSNLRGRFYQLIASAVAVALLAACAGQTKVESDLGIKGAPDWVNEGSQAINDKKGRLIQGVGSAPNLGDPALQKATADNRARAEIARVLSSYLDVAMNDFLASSNGGQETGGAVAESSVQQQINSISQVVLNGSKILGNWKDKRTDIIYSFAELDLKQVQDVVTANKNMSEDLKRYLATQGDAVFDKFVAEK
ncbi:MAG: hypothetical protein JXA04_04195 [Gammaproteobacteria bacterium]|nr:hypothetical protein [Gammaproteobacteria bacterium]